MKYIVIFCITVVINAPAIYKKDVATHQTTVITEKCDSLKFNSVTDMNTFLGSVTSDVKIKAIRTSNK